MAYKSGNPALNKNTFNALPAVAADEAMTLDGVASKSLVMFALCVGFGAIGWRMMTRLDVVSPIFLFGPMLVALVVGFVTIFKKTLAPYTAPLYAALEGFTLGIISQVFNSAYDGIVLQAVLLTASIFLAMLLIYRFRIIRATENFKLGVASATGGIALYYLANLATNLVAHKNLPLVTSNSGFGIGFTVIVIIIASLNLVVDFDFIEQGVARQAPKYMEWYASFGMFVTVVWLYLEILRLLAKGRSR